jgi:hypothetical protein
MSHGSFQAAHEAFAKADRSELESAISVSPDKLNERLPISFRVMDQSILIHLDGTQDREVAIRATASAFPEIWYGLPRQLDLAKQHALEQTQRYWNFDEGQKEDIKYYLWYIFVWPFLDTIEYRTEIFISGSKSIISDIPSERGRLELGVTSVYVRTRQSWDFRTSDLR